MEEDKKRSTDKISDTIKTVTKISSSLNLVGSIIFIVFMLIVGIVFLIFISAPIYVMLIFAFFLIIMLISSIVGATRVLSTNFTPESATLENTLITLSSSEQILNYVSGIMRANSFQVKGVEYLGRGKNRMPENAMILTNSQILFIMVPLDGADTMVSDIDVSMWQNMLASKDIENMLLKMIQTMSLDKIILTSPRNYAIKYSDIKNVKFGSWTQTIKFTLDNKKLSYAIRDKEMFEKAKKIFANYVYA